MNENKYRFVEHSRLHSENNPIINYLTGIGFEIYTYSSGEEYGLTCKGKFNEVGIDVDLTFEKEEVDVIRASNGMEFYGKIEDVEKMKQVLNKITSQ